MLLSIVMMIKNEEKNLKRTLDALIPLMNSLSSELIILDTGSTDKSIEIARNYTDKIFFEKWNDNFSDMRNKSLSYAKGDWLLVLDADEELVDYDRLVDFFNTDLCEKYNSGSITLKNIIDPERNLYDEGTVPRFFKNEKDFRYKGAIHEQPLLKKPIYNNIAFFNHYGYMYTDQELKYKKLKRNEKILFSELKKNPNDPYIYFQIGKNYNAFEEYQEALAYLEKSNVIYNEQKIDYSPVKSTLARIYILQEMDAKCEQICLEYIEKDDCNIDIYYYLAVSQEALNKYEESIKSYKRYLYLIDNYNLSTQSKSIYCQGETIGFRKNAQRSMADIYYYLENYEKAIELANGYEEITSKKLYNIIFKSLYKLGREKEIVDLYNQISNSNAEKKDFLINLEKVILEIKKSDRYKIYNAASKIDGNYGILNKARINEEVSLDKLCQILNTEKQSFYADLVYYGFSKSNDLTTILKDVNAQMIEKYLNYLVCYRKECILEFYDYLINQPNTLDLKKVIIYSFLSKELLLNGGLKNEKYKKLFLMYIYYSYNYIKELYNNNLTDEELLTIIKDNEDRFIINLHILQKIQKENALKYVQRMNLLALEHPIYKNGIKILMEDFKIDFDEKKELKELKIQYKGLVSNNINKGNIKEATKMLEEYKSLFTEDAEIFNMEAIIEITQNNLYKAEILLKNSLFLDSEDYNTYYNIAFIKETLGENKEAASFYKKCLDNCDDENLIIELKNNL